MRNRLISAAHRISASRHEQPVSKLVSARKLFIQEHRDWKRPGAPRVGWKRGELFEVILARSASERAEEWGDCAYYCAQSWDWLWTLYALITPAHIIASSVAKFERRAKGIK